MPLAVARWLWPASVRIAQRRGWLVAGQPAEGERAVMSRRARKGASPSPLAAEHSGGGGGRRPQGDADQDWARFRTRCVSGASMLGGFVLIIMAGHCYCMLLVLALTAGMFKEVVQLRTHGSLRNLRPGTVAPGNSKVLEWIATWNFYGAAVIGASTQVPVLAELQGAPGKAEFQAYLLYTLAIVAFVLSLQKGQYYYQFSLLSWGQTTLALVVVPAFAHIHNLYRGMIWFLMPVSFVVCNDIMAMVCGSFLPGGRRRLIAVSPNKTWEGFCGGGVFTLLLAALLSTAIAADPRLHSWLSCPPEHVDVTPFSAAPDSCSAAQHLFTTRAYTFGPFGTFGLRPIQLHAMVLALFASTVAPFGGFFASGFKRAFDLQDFSPIIPGCAAPPAILIVCLVAWLPGCLLSVRINAITLG